ncbi:DUF2628 domain-containing protein [Clostridium beijerinckii]|uniref:DUF2628 domain-containing protein n=1 Tax=Clostridium beijerinckii TaxID=1520 RepID=UPI00047C0504|nr:DUF2628 domain-containing protein [Clostridium beijerinckii]
MKCPHCEEELGINDVCINPICSHFGTTIRNTEKTNIDTIGNNLNNGINPNNQVHDFDNNSNFNNNSNQNKVYYNRNDYGNNQNTNKFKNIYSIPYNKSNNISQDELAIFIGNNSGFYIKHLNKYNDKHKFLSWNWPCFFFGYYWLLYRKLYVPGAALILLTLISSAIFPKGIHLFLILLIRIIVTLYANFIYLNNCERKIKSFKMNIINIQNLSNTQYINKLRKKGGVNLAAPLIVLALHIMFIVISLGMWLSTRITPHNFSAPSYYF